MIYMYLEVAGAPNGCVKMVEYNVLNKYVGIGPEITAKTQLTGWRLKTMN